MTLFIICHSSSVWRFLAQPPPPEPVPLGHHCEVRPGSSFAIRCSPLPWPLQRQWQVQSQWPSQVPCVRCPLSVVMTVYIHDVVCHWSIAADQWRWQSGLQCVSLRRCCDRVPPWYAMLVALRRWPLFWRWNPVRHMKWRMMGLTGFRSVKVSNTRPVLLHFIPLLHSTQVIHNVPCSIYHLPAEIHATSNGRSKWMQQHCPNIDVNYLCIYNSYFFCRWVLCTSTWVRMA